MAQTMPVPKAASAVLMGTCVIPVRPADAFSEVDVPGHGLVLARMANGLGPQPGDPVVVAIPDGGVPVIIAVLADHANVPLGHGFRLTWSGARARGVAVTNREGEVLLGIEVGETGLTVRVVGQDVAIQAQRRLSLEGDQVHIRSRRTDIEIDANDDVVIVGERIRLN